MSSYPSHIEALRVEAQRVTLESWAIRARLPLSKGIERFGPCPVCGGRDRFSINTKKNAWNCRGCEKGGRDVIGLVMHQHRIEFIPALELITGRSAEDVKGEDPAAKARRRRQMDMDREKAEQESIRRAEEATRYREAARQHGFEIWNRGRRLRDLPPENAATDYLARRGLDLRGIPAEFDALRLASQHPYIKNIGGQFYTLHSGLAMLAAIQRADGRFGAVHQTWLDPGQPKGKALIMHPVTHAPLASKLVRGSKKGGAIRLFTPANPTRLVMGEGVETTLTVMVHAFDPDSAYWAGVDLGNMAGRAARDGEGAIISDMPDMEDEESFIPPEWCKELIYLGEDQDPEVPVKARKNRDALTRGLRRAMRARPGLVGAISWPDGAGDFNDMVGEQINGRMGDGKKTT